MVTKGIITSIDYTGNTCTVRMPFFETAGNDPIVGTAIISNTPGSYNGYKVNDVVLVGFENGQMETPVILGKLYLGVEKEKADPRGVINVESSNTSKSATIPADTKLAVSTDNNVPNTTTPYASLKSIANTLNSVDTGVGQLSQFTNNQFKSIITNTAGMQSAIEQNAADISAKVDKTNEGRTTGFGWTINDEGWKVTSHDTSHYGEQYIDIFKVDNSGVTVAGDVKIVGYPVQTVVLYAQNESSENEPDFPDDDQPLDPDYATPAVYGWSTEEPAWAQGKYIWQKTIVFKYEYNPTTHLLDEVRNSTTVCISGADGQNGVPGESAVSYWLSSNTPIHVGTNQDTNIVINAFKKIGNDAESADTNAYIRYSWDNGETWGDNAVTDGWARRSSLTILKEDVINSDLLIQATHDTTTDPVVIYESETITFAPLDTPVIDLSNDTSAISYYGSIKLGNDVTSTAQVYLGTDELPATYRWVLVGCSGSDLNTATVTITGLSANEATATCIATCIDLKDENGTPVVLTKVFSITKQLSTARFWINVSTPVHTGFMQKIDLVMSLMRKIADESEELDATAYFRYKWGNDGNWSTWTTCNTVDPEDSTKLIGLPYTFDTSVFIEKDLIIEASHLVGSSNYVVFDTETVTYSPLNTPILDLNNDSAAIAYMNGDKINASDTVNATAKVYLNGQAISNLTYTWTLDGIADDAASREYINDGGTNNKIIVKALTKNTATATCSVTNIPDYSGLTLTKDFTITKQLKGEDGKSTIRLSIENDFDTIPCNADGTPSYVTDNLNPHERDDWADQTTHSITVFEGTVAQPFKVYSYRPGNADEYIVQYETDQVTFSGATRTTASSSPYSAHITALTADTGTVIYKLYRNSQLIDTAKFEASKLKQGIPGIDGRPATAYRLSISTPIHTGINQSNDITVVAYAKVGASAETIDDTATIEYKWANDENFTTLSGGDAIPRQSNSKYKNEDLIIKAYHGASEYESETVTYSPLDTPILDLTNDSAAIAYFADGSAPITQGDSVSSTATAFLNGAEISGATYTWSLTGCTSNGLGTVTGKTITIDALTAHTATAACTVSNIGYNGLTISKDFTITKQLQGRSIEGVGEYYLAWNSDDATTLPAFTAANIQTGGSTYTAGKWWDKIAPINATTKYLWNIERLELSGGEYQNTDPAIISIWTKDGKGISSITNYYKVTNSTTVPAINNTWTTTPADVTSSNRYLWNYEVITYTEGLPEPTTPSIIGAYGKDAVDYNIIASDYQIKVPQSGVRNPQSLTFNFTEKVGQEAPTPFAGKYKLYIDDVLVTEDADFNAQTQTNTVTINTATINSINTRLKIELYAYLNNTWTMVENETIETVIDGQDGQDGVSATAYWLDVQTLVHTGSLQQGDIVIKAYSQTGSDPAERDTLVEYYLNNSANPVVSSSNTIIGNGGASLTIKESYIRATYASSDIIITAKHNGDEYDTETITYSPLNTPVLDLSNDSDALVYDVDGTNLSSNVSSTAVVYLNGTAITSGVNIIWSEKVSGSCTFTTNSNTVTVSALTTNNAVLVCTASFTNGSRFYGADPLVKEFTIVKQLKGDAGEDGNDATSYTVNLSSPIHTGILQTSNITVTALSQTGNNSIGPDSNAEFYISGSNTKIATTDSTQNIYLSGANNNVLNIAVSAIQTTYKESDITVTVKHGSVTIDSETITYSPKNTPILDLSNDNAALPYNGNTIIGSPSAETTAWVYLNGEKISGLTYTWTLTNIPHSGRSFTSVTSGTSTGIDNKITITALADDESGGIATCSVTNIPNYQNLTLTKDFTVAKQLKGDIGQTGSSTYTIIISNDFVTLPANGNISDILNPANQSNNPTNHTIICYYGETPVAFYVARNAPDSGTDYALVHTETNVTFAGDERDTESDSAYTGRISALVNDVESGQILYSLYKGPNIVAFAKFEVSKLTAGQDAVSYRLSVSSPVHSGYNQDADVIIIPYVKVGNNQEIVDGNAYIRYRWGTDGTWTNWTDIDLTNKPNVTISGNSSGWVDKDLFIEASHESSGTTRTTYDKETITYASPNAIVLDLDNDSDTIPYKPAPNAKAKVNPGNPNDNPATYGDVAIATASLYKGTVDYSAGATFSWEAPAEYAPGTDYVLSNNDRTIEVRNLKNDTDIFTCKAIAKGQAGSDGVNSLATYTIKPLFKARRIFIDENTFNGNDLTQYVTLTKAFTVSKQVGGEAAISYWINTSCNQITKDPNNSSTLSPSEVDATFWYKSGDSDPDQYSGYYGYKINNGPMLPAIATRATSVHIDATSATTAITVELYADSARTKLLDRATIPVVAEGLNGKYAVSTRTLYAQKNTPASNPTAPKSPAGVTTAGTLDAAPASYTIENITWTDTPDLANTIGQVWWSCEETVFSDGTYHYTAVIRNQEINQITAIKEGKTTNYYQAADPSSIGVIRLNNGDCWFQTIANDQGEYNNETGGSQGKLWQWDSSANSDRGGWVDIGGELVANKVTAQFINALKIKANAITIFNTADQSQQNESTVIFSANDADYKTANQVKAGGFLIGTTSLVSGNVGESDSVLVSTGTQATLFDQSLNWAFTAGGNFGVTTEGKLFANGADLTGSVTATAFTIDTDSNSTKLTIKSGSNTTRPAVTFTAGTGNLRYRQRTGAAGCNAACTTNAGFAGFGLVGISEGTILTCVFEANIPVPYEVHIGYSFSYKDIGYSGTVIMKKGDSDAWLAHVLNEDNNLIGGTAVESGSYEIYEDTTTVEITSLVCTPPEDSGVEASSISELTINFTVTDPVFTMSGSLIPSTDNVPLNLGNESHLWANLYTRNIETARLSASTVTSVSLKPNNLGEDDGIYSSIGTYSAQWYRLFARKIYAAGEAITSDRAKKKDINYDFAAYSSLLDLLKPTTFKWNEDLRIDNGVHFGFIAQDVEQAIADANLAEDNLGLVIKPSAINPSYSLSYNELHALEVYEIQQLKKEIAELKKEIAAIKK